MYMYLFKMNEFIQGINYGEGSGNIHLDDNFVWATINAWLIHVFFNV